VKVGVIADDLTGGNGTGVRLKKQGFNVATMVYYDQPIMTGTFNAIIVGNVGTTTDKSEVIKLLSKKTLFIQLMVSFFYY
jgi:D-threonate/D-erythronate kinase